MRKAFGVVLLVVIVTVLAVLVSPTLVEAAPETVEDGVLLVEETRRVLPAAVLRWLVPGLMLVALVSFFSPVLGRFFERFRTGKAHYALKG